MVFDMIFSLYPYGIDTIWQSTVVSNGSAMFGFNVRWANGQPCRFDVLTVLVQDIMVANLILGLAVQNAFLNNFL